MAAIGVAPCVARHFLHGANLSLCCSSSSLFLWAARPLQAFLPRFCDTSNLHSVAATVRLNEQKDLLAGVHKDHVESTVHSLEQNSHLRQVFTTVHEKVLTSRVSKLHTSIGSGEFKRPHPWLYPLSRNSLMQHMNTHSESSSSEAKQSTDERCRSLNRILYRSKQRGYLELDLILGKWTEENIEKLDDKKLKSLIEVLDLENPELWKWLTGQEVTPEHLTGNPVFMEIHENIMGALKTHAPSETRAKLGQPWVRGWDDNRKVGGPQVGNQ